MDITKVLEELRRELDYLDAAILNLERLKAKAIRRGRPRKLVGQLHGPHRSELRRVNSRGRVYGHHSEA